MRHATLAARKERANLMEALYRAGCTLQQIGDRFGISPQGVSAALKVHCDVEPRAGWLARKRAISAQVPGAVKIPLTRGKFALIDEEDAERVTQYKWCLSRSGLGVLNAVATIDGKLVSLHRFILSAKPDQMVDHADRDRMNNRRSNLRFCTHSQNMANRLVEVGASGFRGVMQRSRPNRAPRFVATISVHNTRFRGPSRETAIHAARDYDELAIKYFGEFAILNFPRGNGGRRLGASHQPAASSPGAQ